MRQIGTLFKRFSEKFPLLYFLVIGVGVGWLLVIIVECLLFLAGGEKLLADFRNVPPGLGIAWIIWHVFKYAYGR